MPPWTEEEASTSQHIIFSNSSHIGHKLVLLQPLPLQTKWQIQIQLCPWIQLCVPNSLVPRLFLNRPGESSVPGASSADGAGHSFALRQHLTLHQEAAASMTELKVWSSLFKWTGHSLSLQDEHFFSFHYT